MIDLIGLSQAPSFPESRTCRTAVRVLGRYLGNDASAVALAMFMPRLGFLLSLSRTSSPRTSPYLQSSAFIANITTLGTRHLYSPLDHFNIVDLLDPPIARASLLRNPIDKIFSGYTTSTTN